MLAKFLLAPGCAERKQTYDRRNKSCRFGHRLDLESIDVRIGGVLLDQHRKGAIDDLSQVFRVSNALNELIGRYWTGDVLDGTVDRYRNLAHAALWPDCLSV